MTVTAFELGRVLYEARIREAWGRSADQRLADHPYPRHPADADVRTQTAEADLAQAQAKAVLASFTIINAGRKANG